MKFSFTLALLLFSLLSSFSVSTQDAHKIAEKIWKNECGGSKDGLTTWNKGENFGSFGIGHFIWYPSGRQERFKESFPDLLKYLQTQNITLPDWLKTTSGCPWTSREEFYNDIGSPQMSELRQFLFDTRDLQAVFIANRLEKTFPELISKLPTNEKERISLSFHRLANYPNGLYALLDYLNFKGAGISSAESYNGQGWGLLQVLQGVPPESENILSAFIDSAKHILTLRVKNSPPERGEERWLKGWINRINSYQGSL